MRIGFVVFLLMVMILPLSARQGAFIAPLEGTFPDEAARIHFTEVLEEGIIKTGVYDVIASSDLDLLLGAQSLAVSEIFSEENNIKIGSLIPAEVMIKGEVLQRGDQLYVHLKVIDLEGGQILFSESVSTASFDTLEEALFLVAFKMAGKPIPSMGPGKSFQLTVHSEPPGGEVFIDRRSYGVTPLVLENVPGGSHFVEIKKENAYFSSSITLEKDQVFYGELVPLFGGLIIEPVSMEGVVVTIDGTNYGKNYFFSSLPARSLEVLLKKEGYFWKGIVPVLGNKTVKIEPLLEPTGSLEIEVDDNVRVSVFNDHILSDFVGTHKMEDLIPGVYTFEAQKPGFVSYKDSVTLKSGEHKVLKLSLTMTDEEYSQILERKALLAALNNTRDVLELPEIYFDNPVPVLNQLALRNSLLSLSPLGGLLFFSSPALPSKLKNEYKRSIYIQFALGCVFQGLLYSSLFIPSIEENGPLKIGFLIGSAIFGAGDLAFSIYKGSTWDSWTRETRNKKLEYDELTRQIEGF